MAAKKKRVVVEEISTEPVKYRYISAFNEEQKDYIRSIVHNDLTICYGTSGSGKTTIAAGIGADFLKRNLVDKLIISRPCVGAEDLGYLPGDQVEKIDPYMQPLYTELSYYINVKAAIAQEKIVVLPVSYMRGCTFKNSFIIVDEAENLSKRQLKLILTRFGDSSKMVLNGDTSQSDLPAKDSKDFQIIIERLRPIATPENKVGIICLKTSVRHPLVELIVKTLED